MRRAAGRFSLGLLLGIAVLPLAVGVGMVAGETGFVVALIALLGSAGSLVWRSPAKAGGACCGFAGTVCGAAWLLSWVAENHGI